MRYFDLHIHGAFGIDVTRAGAGDLDRLAERLESCGYGSFLPTLVPLAPDELEAVLERLGAWLGSRIGRDARGAMPVGLHLEGPFLNPARAGALRPERLLDGRDDARVGRLLAAIDRVPGNHMVTLAPEIPGGLELIREFRRRDFLVAVGHTDADLATLERAVEAGARHVTHFCNAMRPFHHREPGPIGFGLLHSEVSVDVVADLHHVHPAVLKLIARAKRPDRLVLISDASPVAGFGDGDYEVWDERITVRDGQARNAAGSLAGSAVLLGDCVRNMQALGLPAEHVLDAASSVPLQILRGSA